MFFSLLGHVHFMLLLCMLLLCIFCMCLSLLDDFHYSSGSYCFVKAPTSANRETGCVMGFAWRACALLILCMTSVRSFDTANAATVCPNSYVEQVITPMHARVHSNPSLHARTHTHGHARFRSCKHTGTAVQHKSDTIIFQHWSLGQ